MSKHLPLPKGSWIVILIAVVCLGASTPFCVAAPAGDLSAKVPASLVDVGEFGENIYDAARDKDWDAAAKKLASLKDALRRFRSDLPNATAEQQKGQDQLAAEIAALDKAIPDKQRQAVMETANRATLVAAELMAPFHPKTPVAVTRLDYLGRELEIGAAASDVKRLQNTADDIRGTWSKLRPEVESHGGAAEAKKFDKLVEQVVQAKTPEEYGRVATPLLDAVDELEKVFGK